MGQGSEVCEYQAGVTFGSQHSSHFCGRSLLRSSSRLIARYPVLAFDESVLERGIGMVKKERIPEHLRPWIEARRRFRLSHMHIQMARELGMNPRKFGKLANHRQEPWKAPLPIFIETIYFKRFRKEKPDRIETIAEVAAAQAAKRAATKLARQARKAEKLAACSGASTDTLGMPTPNTLELTQESEALSGRSS